jgi:hypothetical protein
VIEVLGALVLVAEEVTGLLEAGFAGALQVRRGLLDLLVRGVSLQHLDRFHEDRRSLSGLHHRFGRALGGAGSERLRDELEVPVQGHGQVAMARRQRR